MTLKKLEYRVTSLEEQVAQLKINGQRAKDWRRTVGMFTGDELMKRIDEEALRFREEDRAKAKRTKRRVRAAES
jgi:hypothetical protein